MPRFAANLSMLFTEVPFLDRFALAAKAGFEAVEFMFPYAFSMQEIKERVKAADLQIVLHNLPAGDWEAGERGIACHPGREEEFRALVHQGVSYALELGVAQLNCLAGVAPKGQDAGVLRQTLLNNLRYAAKVLNDNGIRLLLEPINPFDMPGFILNRTADAVALLDEVDADTAFVQYDIYHAQRVEGELSATLQKYLPRIGHIQLADNPGRHEPGSGEINYPFLLEHLDSIGYQGWVGCEYRPARSTEEGLGWLDGIQGWTKPTALL